MVGVIHWVLFPGCQFSGTEKLRLMPAMVRALGLRSAVRVTAWLSAWSKLDPTEPHSHLDLIGVEPEMQGRRIGHRLEPWAIWKQIGRKTSISTGGSVLRLSQRAQF
jgi:hypothetical protein